MNPPARAARDTSRPEATLRRSLPQRLKRRALRTFGRPIVGTVTHVVTPEPVAALTFDDGPHPVYTPRLLDVLERHGAHGTFFMLGVHARRYPKLVEEVARRGHAVANHSFDHPKFPACTAQERRRQIRACELALAPFGHRLFRPPHGLQSVASRLDALRLGYDVVTWNVMVEDWEVRDSGWMADRLARDVRPGSIVLLHDLVMSPTDPRADDRGPMIAALDRYLGNAAAGLSFVTVPELLRRGQAHRAIWLVRNDDDWAGHDPS